MTGLALDEQTRQVAELRQRLFPTEQERLMAQLKDLNESADLTGMNRAN